MKASEAKKNHLPRTHRTVAIMDYDGCGANLDNSVFMNLKISQVNTMTRFKANQQFQQYISPRMPLDQALTQMDNYITQHSEFPTVKRYLEQLKSKVDTFQKTYVNQPNLSKETIKTGYTMFNAIFEKLTAHLFMGQLFKAGYQTGEPLTLLNGAARQSAIIDLQNNHRVDSN